jgi:hypothetical protein
LAITNHYYGELTPEQRMDANWDPDNAATWNAFFANRQLARYEGDGPPPVNYNEEGHRLWWGGRTLDGAMDHISAGDYPRLRYPHFQPKKAGGHVVFWDPSSPNARERLDRMLAARPEPKPQPGWVVPPEYAAAARLQRRPGDPEEFPGQRAAIRASLEPPAPGDAWWRKEEEAYRTRGGGDGEGYSRCGHWSPKRRPLFRDRAMWSRSVRATPPRPERAPIDDEDDDSFDDFEDEYYRPRQEYD